MKKLHFIMATIFIAMILCFSVQADAATRVQTKSTVYLRTSKSDTSKKKATIKKGEVLLISKTSGSWSYTTFDGQSGWVKSNLTSKLTVKYTRWAKTKTYAYTKRNTKSTKVVTIPKEKKVSVYTTLGSFSYVSYNGKYGWTLTSGLNKTDPSKAKKDTTQKNNTITSKITQEIQLVEQEIELVKVNEKETIIDITPVDITPEEIELVQHSDNETLIDITDMNVVSGSVTNNNVRYTGTFYTPYQYTDTKFLDDNLNTNERKLAKDIWKAVMTSTKSEEYVGEYSNINLKKVLSMIAHNWFVFTGSPRIRYEYGNGATRYYVDVDYTRNILSKNEVYIQQSKNIVSSYVNPAAGTRDKVLAIERAVKDYLQYTTNRDSISALSSGRGACGTYSDIFRAACMTYGIECRKVLGEGYFDGTSERHAWNQVKVNGAWQYIDVTWNDTSETNEYTLASILWDDHIILPMSYFFNW